MLAVILTYHSFFEFLPNQLQNLKNHITVPFKIYLVDNSQLPGQKFTDPLVTYLFCHTNTTPSDRHQSGVNLALAKAWGECDCFLLFDNDMIFVEPFTPPAETHYLPQRRGNLEYGWLNLMFFWKSSNLNAFGFANCPDTGERTDSGGSFGWYLRSGAKTKQIEHLEADDCLVAYQNDYKELCTRYGVKVWYDIFRINNSKVFHFRALSNWTKYPQDFQTEKKALILRHTTVN